MAIRDRRHRHPVSHPEFEQGAGVRATRAQADRLLYQAIRTRLENQPNLTIFQQAVDDLLHRGRIA